MGRTEVLRCLLDKNVTARGKEEEAYQDRGPGRMAKSQGSAAERPAKTASTSRGQSCCACIVACNPDRQRGAVLMPAKARLHSRHARVRPGTKKRHFQLFFAFEQKISMPHL